MEFSKAKEVFLENFKPVAWYGRCIFLSWYCDVGTCKFCYRSTQKAIPKIVKQFTSLFDHPSDADKFLAKLQNSDFQTALRHYTAWCQTKEGAVIEMINNLTIDSLIP